MQPIHQLIGKPFHDLGLFTLDDDNHAVKIFEAFPVLLVQGMKLHVLGDQIFPKSVELEVCGRHPNTESRQNQGNRQDPPRMVISQGFKGGKYPVQKSGIGRGG